MATLNSPGVSVSVIDESFYTTSAPGTVPMIFVASAQDKTNPSGSTALGTTAANAGKVWLMTSQRDLTDTFGTPKFYTDASGNPQHGNELNEYGLQAAYSALGVSSRAYVVRADIDTGMLIPTSNIPKGEPVGGTYWVDTNASHYGIKEWNNTTKKFTVKTPLILNDDSTADEIDMGEPTSNVGKDGDYCIVVTKDNENSLYHRASGTWNLVYDNFEGGKSVQISTHYDYPDTGTWTTGSVWITTTTATNGAKWTVKRYNSSSRGWDTVTAPLYTSIPAATKAIDGTGGLNIATGSVFIETDYNQSDSQTATFKLWRRAHHGITSIVSAASTSATASQAYDFKIRETTVGSNTWSSWVNGTVIGDGAKTFGSALADAINSMGTVNISASYNSTTHKITVRHNLGGDFEIRDTTNPFSSAGFTVYNTVTKTGTDNLYTPNTGDQGDNATFLATNWKALVYEAKNDAPYTTPSDGTLWCNATHDEVDIMIHDGSTWVGYASVYPDADPLGPIVAVIEPIEQSDGSDLVDGDIWVSTANMDRYGNDLYVYDSTIMTGSKWVAQDTTDQSSPTGWLFADARWSNSGTDDFEYLESIPNLLVSDYLDPDAPDPALYPKGMRLWNTRRSGNNVKKFVSGYIDITANDGLNTRYQDEDMAAYNVDRWVSQHNVAEDGSGVFGRLAQRAQVVAALKHTIDTNSLIRDTDTVVFNLIVAPGYSEAIANMVSFNTDRGITAFVIGDTPFRLKPNGTDLAAYGKNTNLALDNNEKGAVTHDEYMAMYYPSGYTNDNSGNYIVVPPSHMMLRTYINNDNKSYVWFAPAGTRRGGIDNATSVGYITEENEFKTAAIYQSLRDVMQDPTVQLNPIATLVGAGLVAFGQRTRARNSSSLDRVNVARLVCYLRRQLDILARPYLFEPNDAQTRREIKAAAESLMQELVGQRALYDYIVVCDESNNTPSRIDRNELYMDIAIEPVKAIEFIYIPLRLKNTGAIKAGL
jgi:hypothetical protein